MEVLVVTGVGEAGYKWVETTYRGIPPRYFRLYSFKKPRNLLAEPSPEIMDIQIDHLPIHKLGGLPVRYAYWPEDWSDELGLVEVCSFFHIKFKV